MNPSHPIELRRVLLSAFVAWSTASAGHAMASPAAFDDASTASHAARACLSASTPDCMHRSAAALLIDEGNGIFIPTFRADTAEPSMLRSASGASGGTNATQRPPASPALPIVALVVDRGPLLGEPSTVALTFAGLACVLWVSQRRTRSDSAKARKTESMARGVEQDALHPDS